MKVKQVLFSQVAVLIIFVAVLPRLLAQQHMSKDSLQSAESMLQTIAGDIRNNYYDPKFHGLDWDAVVADAKQKIEKSATFDIAVLHIAALVDGLNDSHTTLYPPRTMVNVPLGSVRDGRSLIALTSRRHDYGWKSGMFGERCLVTHVRPGSDAEKKGLHAGDEIVSLNGYRPERATIQRAEYVFNELRPQDELKLEVVDPTGEKRHLTVAANVRDVPIMSQYEQGERTIHEYEDREEFFRPRVAELGDDLAIIRVPRFFLTLDAVQSLIDKARKHNALIIDLRDNPGGAEEALQHMLGGVFDHEVKIADKVTRSERKKFTAKPLRNTFDGKIVVLIDSRSRSAAEIFSRVVQLQKRGLVIGDGSAGSVMEARFFQHQFFGAAVFYGASITIADLVMSDGRSLEHAGVTPDEIVTPAASDLAKGFDPVLSHAAETLGVKLSPEQAGKLFPYQWAPD